MKKEQSLPSPEFNIPPAIRPEDTAGMELEGKGSKSENRGKGRVCALRLEEGKKVGGGGRRGRRGREAYLNSMQRASFHTLAVWEGGGGMGRIGIFLSLLSRRHRNKRNKWGHLFAVKDGEREAYSNSSVPPHPPKGEDFPGLYCRKRDSHLAEMEREKKDGTVRSNLFFCRASFCGSNPPSPPDNLLLLLLPLGAKNKRGEEGGKGMKKIEWERSGGRRTKRRGREGGGKHYNSLRKDLRSLNRKEGGGEEETGRMAPGRFLRIGRRRRRRRRKSFDAERGLARQFCLFEPYLQTGTERVNLLYCTIVAPEKRDPTLENPLDPLKRRQQCNNASPPPSTCGRRPTGHGVIPVAVVVVCGGGITLKSHS